MHRIRLDQSPRTILVVCECGYRELCLSEQVAHRIAVLHEHSVHPDQRQAADAARAATRRAHRNSPPSSASSRHG